jgi:type III secretion system-like peptide-binding chaperone
MRWFKKKEKENEKPQVDDLKEATRLVGEVLAKIGLDDRPKTLRDGKGFGWSIRRGSAVVFITVNRVDGQAYFRLVSPILYLPTENLLPLYRTLLGINMDLTSAALAVHEDRVCVVSERPVLGLDAVEADDLIKRVSYYADVLDNKLSAEFGARLYTDGEQPQA